MHVYRRRPSMMVRVLEMPRESHHREARRGGLSKRANMLLILLLMVMVSMMLMMMVVVAIIHREAILIHRIVVPTCITLSGILIAR